MDCLNLCYQKSDSIISRSIAGETLLVPIRQNVGDLESIYTLNETAAYIWEEIDGTRTLQEICEAMVNTFATDAKTAQEDLVELIEQLETVGAIQRV